jgi:hypothetical protein
MSEPALTPSPFRRAAIWAGRVFATGTIAAFAGVTVNTFVQHPQVQHEIEQDTGVRVQPGGIAIVVPMAVPEPEFTAVASVAGCAGALATRPNF